MITINVTQKDINSGIRADCHVCPVAIAVSRVLGLNDVEISAASIYADFAGSNYYREARIIQPLPLQVRSYIRAFDAGNEIEPFSFNLDMDIKDVRVKNG